MQSIKMVKNNHKCQINKCMEQKLMVKNNCKCRFYCDAFFVENIFLH